MVRPSNTIVVAALWFSGCAGHAPRPADHPPAGAVLSLRVDNHLGADYRVDDLEVLLDGESILRTESTTMDDEIIAALEPGESRVAFQGQVPSGAARLDVRGTVWEVKTSTSRELTSTLELQLPPREIALAVILEEGAPGEAPSLRVERIALSELHPEGMCVEKPVTVEKPDCAPSP